VGVFVLVGSRRVDGGGMGPGGFGVGGERHESMREYVDIPVKARQLCETKGKEDTYNLLEIG
jgi:hypothetical protein